MSVQKTLMHEEKYIAWLADDSTIYTVTQDGITEIREHRAQGEGDRWFYDVHYETGKVIRVFDPHQVCFTPEPPEGLAEGDIPF